MGFFDSWINGEYGWTFIFLIISFFTIITIIFYYKMDKFEPEPKSRILLAFVLGLCSIIIALVFSFLVVFIIGNNEFLTTIVISPIIEEFSKGFIVVYLSKSDSFDGPLDGFIYGSMVGVGFAFGENLMYAFSQAVYFGITSGAELATMRSLTQMIGHPLYTGIMGVGVGEFKVGISKNKYQQIWRSILMHSLWNGAATVSIFGTTYFFIAISIVIIASIFILRNELILSIKLDKDAMENGYYERKAKFMEAKRLAMLNSFSNFK